MLCTQGSMEELGELTRLQFGTSLTVTASAHNNAIHLRTSDPSNYKIPYPTVQFKQYPMHWITVQSSFTPASIPGTAIIIRVSTSTGLWQLRQFVGMLVTSPNRPRINKAPMPLNYTTRRAKIATFQQCNELCLCSLLDRSRRSWRYQLNFIISSKIHNGK